MLNNIINKRLLKFGLSGLFVTTLHIILVIGMVQILGIISTYANAIAFMTATVISYLINTLWSFSSRINKKNITRFILVSILIVPCLTFILHNFWTYRSAYDEF